MACFFPWKWEEGEFDEKDLIFCSNELNAFLNESKENGFDRLNVIAVGYSNGANIAANLLIHYADALRVAIIHHPMVPRRGIDLPDLTGIPVFITTGKNDPVCPSKESEELEELLVGTGAMTEVPCKMNGHSLTRMK